ncbi:MAG: T9SS type A sorting domain-containing protein [Ignavibacteria bacterium]|nr:T9SS type A sorting domain-containing protein [Ignavibacteria bacterium]
MHGTGDADVRQLGGVYIPDPFEFKAVVTNAGQAEGQDLSVTAQLPPGVILASGETATKLIGNLAVSASAEVKWLVRPVSNTSGANVTVRLCAKVVDKLGKENDCCSDVIIPPATKATLSLTCDSQFDTLKVDRQRGTYETNPFMVYVKITNNGDRPADNVRVVVLPQSNELRVLGDPERYVAARLDQKVTTDTIGWKIYATPRTVSGWIDIQFVVTADGLASTQCTKPVYVPEVGRPSLTCNTQSSMSCSGDTLYFNYSIGDYRDCNGTRSSTGKYNVFTITSHILNGGAAQANRVRATLLPPEGVTLDAGETAIKDAGDLLVNGSTSVSWNIRPVRQSFDAQRTFSVVLTSDNALQQKCDQTVTVQGAPKIVTVRMPDNNVGQFKQKITIPVYVDTTIGKDIYVYKLNVKFDPELVRFVDAVSTNTLTARGWSGPRTRLLATPGSAQSNVVRVEDYTTGSPLNVRDEGMLVLLVFEAVYNGGEKSLRAEAKPIEFLDKVDVDVAGSPKTWYSSMNSPDDESAGTDVQLNYIPGVITVSGDCIVPLIGGTHYSLAQNKPNPFNPSTVIEYEIGEETEVRLVVFDQLGREVAVPVNARQKAGKYAVIFDASTLASGTYVYRIETAQFTKTLRMVLAR